MDYRAIGTMQGARDAGEIYRRTINRWADHAETLETRLRLARADAAATDAGRLAQIHALRRALETVAPFDPVLARTGRVYAGGDPEVAYEAGFSDAYDDAARGTGLERCVRPMTPAERAEAAEAEVLAETIEIRGWWLWERVVWRGGHYRTVAGAGRARAEEAKRAREGVGS